MNSGPARRGPGLLGVIGALIGGIILAIITLITFGLALLFSRRPRRTPRRPRTQSPGTSARAHAAPGSESAATPREERSYAEIIEAIPAVIAGTLLLALLGATFPAPAQAKLLVPMDSYQTDHLKAYGLTFWVLTRGQKAEWLLNYRGGSFLLDDDELTEREANVRGVSFERIAGAEEAKIRAIIADENMESVALEKAPEVAVYIPPNTPPWDDAVTLALKYADIPYATVWDEEVLKGDLVKYDWLHLHHEDFTGQHGKFYAAYHSFPWYQEEEQVQREMASRLGFTKVSQLKGAVARNIRDYVGRGGFMFGMCSATDTYDIAIAASGLDIVDVVYDGDPPDFSAQGRLDYDQTLAFKDFRLEMDPFIYRFSTIDITQEASMRGRSVVFSLFDFSAKNDPVPTMLVQNHVSAVPEFLGQTTGFRRSLVKSNVLVLGEVESTSEVKYLHGQVGRGTFTFLGGHDPEDYQHMVGDPPTELSRHKHSPGYRLILNNVLFPAAEKKKQRT
jgi:hypothetical protein